MDRLTIVLGLGNPGARYRATRHNVGFWVLDRLAERRRVKFRLTTEIFGRAWTAEVEGPSGPVVLAKPRTHMNRSGRAATALCRRYAAQPEQVLVVHDDADLELGRLRVRPGGRAGGHNGMRSLIDALRTDRIPRVRLGVRGAGRDDVELADYVLEDFAPDEVPIAERLADLALEAVGSVLDNGLATTMNRYNARLMTLADRPDRSEED